MIDDLRMVSPRKNRNVGLGNKGAAVISVTGITAMGVSANTPSYRHREARSAVAIQCGLDCRARASRRLAMTEVEWFVIARSVGDAAIQWGWMAARRPQ
jgi:hypothetical protein